MRCGLVPIFRGVKKPFVSVMSLLNTLTRLSEELTVVKSDLIHIIEKHSLF